MLTDNANSLLPDTKTGDASSAPSVPPISTDVSITSVPSSPPLGPCAPSSPEPEPLTPLTPLTPSPSPSPSLSGHDRHTSSSPPSPLNESLPLPVPVESAPLPSNPLPPPSSHPPLSAEDCTSSQPTLLSPHPSHLSLHPPLDNLIPFDSLPSNFDSGVPLHLDAHHDNLHEDPHPQPHVPQLPGHFPNPQPDQVQPPQVQYVRPPFTQVPGRDREVNIWKLACQERVESLFRRYGVETIKAIIASEAGSAIVNGAPHESPNLMPNSFPEPPTQGNSAHVTQPPQTRFRLYTPASYTWSSRTVLGSGSSPGKRSSNDNPQGTEVEREAMWMESDLDVDVEMDIDVDMDDDDEDYEDEDEIGELEGDADAESRAKLDLEEANGRGSAAVQPLREGLQAMDVKGEAMMMDVDYTGQSQRARLRSLRPLTSRRWRRQRDSRPCHFPRPVWRSLFAISFPHSPHYTYPYFRNHHGRSWVVGRLQIDGGSWSGVYQAVIRVVRLKPSALGFSFLLHAIQAWIPCLCRCTLQTTFTKEHQTVRTIDRSHISMPANGPHFYMRCWKVTV
ncbi:hypothetical protein EDD15DRAFT_262251 [Pisolithus albus]|nr:hypothetical protein EDD15DRAFT_262251 [Pisolithus albus]